MNPVKNNLVALGSAAVLSVYAAGYLRTKAAADRFAGEESDRRRAVATTEYTPGPQPGLVASDSVAPTTRDEAPARAVVDSTAARIAKPTRVTAEQPAQHASTVATTTASAAASTGGALASAAAKLQDSALTPHIVASTATTVTPPPASGIQGGAGGVAIGDSASPSGQNARGQFKDGSYSGWGTSRHGDIQATVEIREGRIVSASITQCLTRYSCSWISHLPGQVVTRQSANVDYVSGATQSTNAFYYAVVEALSKAK